MGDKNDDDGLSLTLSLSLRTGENATNFMHKPPQSVPVPVPNQRASFRDLFRFHDRSAEPSRSFLHGIDVNPVPAAVAAVAACDDENRVSSPNSTISTISGKRSEREGNGDDAAERGSCSRGGSDDDDGGGCGGEGDGDGDPSRKKLRLSKEQAMVLEETFKEHNTLNPKQKQTLAKQLNLRPRQVEVWFQNRRARTKLKQTEVDCEYLKRCCENLTEENRRLQKEVQELRALKLSPQLYMHMNPPTTLTMCPSCERVAPAAVPSAPAPAPAPANRNLLGPTIQRPVPLNPWAAMAMQPRTRP